MALNVCFMAGESAERSWRHVMPFLPRDCVASYHELRGASGTAPGYSWQDEVDALAAALPADMPGHLVGLSAGGTLALAFLAAHPERVASLSLVEPAWSFLPLGPIEREYFGHLDAILRLPAAEARDGFRRLIVRADVPLPALRADIAERERERQAIGQPSPLRAMTDAMQWHPLDPAAFGRFPGRVLIAIGGRSHPMWRDQAASLAAAFPSSRVEVFEERHHLAAPQKAEPERMARLLEWAWAPDSGQLAT
jgi:pimeloyl-ACP methyl ester carboxylesterase